MFSYIIAAVVAVLSFAVDRLSKAYIVNNMALGESAELLPGLFNLYFVHNSGGAWGILAGYTWVLLTLTAVIMIIGITVLICKGLKNPWLFWSISLILSGGLGNMYDRIFNAGRVVDFIQFDFWQTFPIFNIADCAIVVGCGILILYFVLDAVRSSAKPAEESHDDNQ